MMTRSTPIEVPESRTSLAGLVAAPVVWAMHFLLSYGTAAIWCAKVAGPTGSFDGARRAIVVYTVAALVAIVVIAARAWRARRPGEPTPDDRDTSDARHRFIAAATLLLAGLSAIAVVYAAMAALLVGSCR